jgi:hypothetical protein
LSINDCNLSSIDISENISLQSLVCSGNNIYELNVSHNTSLYRIYCNDCNLSELDISENTLLSELNCSGNKLTYLDVTGNTGLMILKCATNQLTTLDLSENTVLGLMPHYCMTDLDISQMPTLSKVCVWVMPFPPSSPLSDDCYKLVIYSEGSPNVYFTTECSE